VEAPASQRQRRRRRVFFAALRWAALAGCVALFVHALLQADLAAAWTRIRAIGPLALVILVPFPLAMAADAWAWQRLLAALERKVSVLELLDARLAIEAVMNSAPMGAVWGDAIAPVLVARRTGLPVTDVFASTTAKRWTVVRTHGAYVALAAAAGAGAVERASHAISGGDLLLVAVFAGALTLMLISFGIEAIAGRAQIAGRVCSALDGTRFWRVRKWIAEQRHHFERADVQLARLSTDRRAQAGAASRMSLLWFTEGVETYVILRLLGVPLGLAEVMSFDASLSVLRSVAVFAPAGIGVQDVGYLTVLGAYGVPDAGAVGPAFVLLKRMKEAFWIAIGFILLARAGGRHLVKTAIAEAAAD
jgi:hypothetical protein